MTKQGVLLEAGVSCVHGCKLCWDFANLGLGPILSCGTKLTYFEGVSIEACSPGDQLQQ